MQRPTGGPKDSIAPKMLHLSPDNFSKNFKAKEIVFTFDEYIKFTNHFKEFSISPDVDVQPTYRIKKKSLHIELPDSLAENTTYTLNFGKGLVDYNEGNPFLNYNYVFATGDKLDSLSLSGKVINGFTKDFDAKRDADTRILLIPTAQDSIFGKRKANIFVNTDSSGNFQFNNLRADTYRIYALKEQNNDRIFNGTEEWLGFLNDSIVLEGNIQNVQLEMTKGLAKEFRIMDKKIEKNGTILLTFNKPVESPNIRILHPAELDEHKIVQLAPTADTMTVYIDSIAMDSVKIAFMSAPTVTDTILIRVNKNEKYDRQILPQLNINNKVDRVKHIILRSSSPIEEVDKAQLILTEDSVSRRNFQLQKDSLNDQIYYIRYNWRANKNYELSIPEGTIRGPFQTKNKKFNTKFTFDPSENYGDIHFTFTGMDSLTQYIVELIDDKKEKVFDRKILQPGTTELNYEKFPGGKYSLRVIHDTNKNGRWDAADIYDKRQAENIWYLNKSFTIRANWEQRETLNISTP